MLLSGSAVSPSAPHESGSNIRTRVKGLRNDDQIGRTSQDFIQAHGHTGMRKHEEGNLCSPKRKTQLPETSSQPIDDSLSQVHNKVLDADSSSEEEPEPKARFRMRYIIPLVGAAALLSGVPMKEENTVSSKPDWSMSSDMSKFHKNHCFKHASAQYTQDCASSQQPWRYIPLKSEK